MCGITGIFSNNINDLDLKSCVDKMAKIIIHRGPDEINTWVDKKKQIAFGHTRLSVLDLSSAGSQPMHSSCGQYTIVFNGEIYNHLALRDKLSNSGANITWNGHSDTETLVECFSIFGIEKTLDMLIGMFAIAIWNNKTENLTLVRDRFGEKPLYYGWSNGVFLFGSELKALQKYKSFNNKINRNSLYLYMQYMNVPSPYSIFENIYKLEPGSFLQISAKGLSESKINREPFSSYTSSGLVIDFWYRLDKVAKNGQDNLFNNKHDVIESLENVLSDSIKLQMLSDVPIGAFLSGGVDSSLIVSLMQSMSMDRINTFSIGFKERGFNEAVYAKKVANYLNTNHTEMYVTSKHALDVIPSMSFIYDEPFADSSQIPTYILSKLTRNSVKVALSGDAGDELFGGYNRYLWGASVWNKLKKINPEFRKIAGTLIRKTPTALLDKFGLIMPGAYSISSLGDKMHRMAYRLKTAESINDIYFSMVTEGFENNGLVLGRYLNPLESSLRESGIVSKTFEYEHQMMLMDSMTYLPNDILTKVDRAAMGASLETRIPFLDYRIVELAWSIPLNMKINNKVGKYPLREILYKNVPKRLIERPKAGFSVPVGDWIRGPLYEWANELLSEEKIKRDGYLNHNIVSTIWRQHIDKKYDWSMRLWTILMFQSWLEHNYK